MQEIMEKEKKEIEQTVLKYGKVLSIMHYVNKETLKEIHNTQQINKATGIDKITKEIYDSNLENNMEELIGKMRKFSYRPQAVKRTYIPKQNGKLRPLGIPSYEDKLVQGVMTKCLNAIYETKFEYFSYGFRENKNCHKAIREINQIIMTKKVNYILDTDIKGFFDNVDHKILIKMLSQDIKDKNFIRYIVRFLKSGILEQGVYRESIKGTPQGGIISPVLANVYLHYLLDKWFVEQVKPKIKGEAYIIRYADDFVVMFQYENEANKFYEILKERMALGKLELEESKTRIIPFGRFKGTKENFEFLGFTFSNGKTRTSKYTLNKTTSKKKLKSKKEKVKKFLKENMHLGILETIKKLKKVLIGHYAYYGISGNLKSLYDYYLYVRDELYRTKMRTSQRAYKNKSKITNILKYEKLPLPKIYINIWA